MRVTRAALRAGKVIHEDEDASPATTPTQTTQPVLQDITSKNILVVEAPQTPKAAIQRSISESVLSQAILSKTPKFDPELPLEVVNTRKDAESVDTNKEDSFIEHIIARSPKKPVIRIEDSVEAMDALEDAIEHVSQNLPVIEDIQVQSPVKARKASTKAALKPTAAKMSSKKPEPTSRKALPAKPTPAARHLSPIKKAAPLTTHQPKTAADRLSSANPTKRSSPASKTTVHRPSVANNTKRPPQTAKTTVARPSIANTTKRPSPSAPVPRNSLAAKMPASRPKPAALDSKSPPAPLPNTMQKRKISASLSTSKPGFVPAKSSKPATMSSFTLPGEAIAAKLKAQREERQKREEAAEQSKKEQKPKAVISKAPKPAAPQPRQTKTSQARLSMMAGGNKENVAPRIVSTTAKTDSTLSVTKGRVIGAAKANTAVRRTTVIPSGTTIAPLAENKVDAEELRAKAKKAREEAAERGRIASREWAEKQKKKAMVTAGAKGPVIAEEKPAEAIAG